MPTTQRSDITLGLAISMVVVPLSRSATSEAALGPAAEVARHFGAGLHVVTVGIEQSEADAMAARVAELAAGRTATVDTWVDWDVPGGILAAARQQPLPLICMASHARGRLGEAALGSFTTALLREAVDPVLLVGPALEPPRHLADGPVFACVDGSSVSAQIVPVAARWATALGVPLRIVTVAEPALAGLDRREPYRGLGPNGDPRAYVDGLAHTWRGLDIEVSGHVVFDPIGPAEGLATELETTPCGLVAVTTHARTGLTRAVLGSRTTSILRHSPVPVLVVPLHHG